MNPSQTPQRSRSSILGPDGQLSLLSGLIGFIFVLGVALIQAHNLAVGPLDLHQGLRLLATGCILGFLPAALLTRASLWLKARDYPPKIKAALFWLPSLLAWAMGAYFLLSEAYPFRGDDPFKLALTFGGLLIPAFAFALFWRRTRGRPFEPPYWLFPGGLVWVALTYLLARSIEAGPGAGSIVGLTLVFIAIMSPRMSFATVGWSASRIHGTPRLSANTRRLLIVGGWCLSLAFIAWMHTFFVGIYLLFKAWVALNILLGLWLFASPLMPPRLAQNRGVSWGMLGFSSLFLVASLWMFLSPISQRFGAFGSRSMVGIAVQTISFVHDADGDGYYAESAGGNDCDDTDPQAHPAATEASKNCWARARLLQPRRTWQATAKPDELAPSKHIIVYIIDAMRADLLEDPQAAADFPNLSQFADEAQVFERAYSPGNSTMTSFHPILTGVWPVHTLTSINQRLPLPTSEMISARSLFELQPEQFCNVMVATSHKPHNWLVGHLSGPLQVAHGRAEVDELGHSTPPMVDAFEAALGQCEGRPIMAVLYSDDPHRDDARAGYSCADGSVGGRECYREAIGVVDREFGRLRGILEERGILEDAFFAITSDHGEAFGEHGHTTHTSSVFEEQIHVPLLVHLPRSAPQRIRTPVSLLGLKATIAEAAGLALTDTPTYPSWMGLIADPASDYPPPISENWMGAFLGFWTAPSSAFIDGDDKLIYDWKTGYVRLYDLAQDPGETQNLAQAQPEKTKNLLRRFKAQEASHIIHYQD